MQSTALPTAACNKYVTNPACAYAVRTRRYAPHLDKWPHEVNNNRALTVLLYTNVGWDAAAQGGCLRLYHPSATAAAIAAEQRGESRSAIQKLSAHAPSIDVAPVAGRIVIFDSAKQLHEVLPTTSGAERLALTLWVERAV